LFQSLFGGSMGSSRAAGSSSSQGRNSSLRGTRRGGMSNESPGNTPPFPGRWDEETD
jgi:E3 ubiquitin-protein ligase RNF115/126